MDRFRIAAVLLGVSSICWPGAPVANPLAADGGPTLQKPGPQAFPSGSLGTRVRALLGEPALQIIQDAEIVEVGRLQIIAAARAESNSLRSLRTIAGYPLAKGALNSIAREQRATLLGWLLADASYAWNLGLRCRNTEMLGIRFTRGGDRVELAFGLPCKQAIWAFRREERVGRWGGVLSAGAADFLRTLPVPSREQR